MFFENLSIDPFLIQRMSQSTWQLSVQTFRLSDPNLHNAKSISYFPRKDKAVNFIPDYHPSLFRSGRISRIKSLNSGIYEYQSGVPRLIQKLDFDQHEENEFTLQFGEGFPAPQKTLDIVFYPPIVQNSEKYRKIIIRYQDGTEHHYSFKTQSRFYYILLAAMLFILLNYHDRITIKKVLNEVKYRRRLLVYRSFGLICFAPLTQLFQRGFVDSKNPMLQLLLCGYLAVMLGFGLLVKKPFDRKRYNIVKWKYGVSIVIILAYPWIIMSLPIFAAQQYQGYLMTEYNYFRNRIVRRLGEEPIVLFMGGSSTEGEDYYRNEQLSIVKIVEKSLYKKFPKLKTANGGVVATTSNYAIKYLPYLLYNLQPDVVVFNYMFNDQSIVWGSFVTDHVYDRYRQKLRTLAKMAKEYGAQPVFIIEPYFPHIYQNSRRFQDQITCIRQVANEEHAVVIDPRPVFSQRKESFLFINDTVHLTIFGNQLMAETVAPVLEKILHQRNKGLQTRTKGE